MTALPDRDEIAVPDRPALPGLRFRHIRMPKDFAGMAAANQANRDRNGIEEMTTAEGMARDYAHFVNWVPRDDTVIAEVDGRIVGYVRTEWRDRENGTRAFTTILVVHPDLEAAGIYPAFLGWAEGRLGELARSVPPDRQRPGVMVTFTFGGETVLASLLEARGWRREGHGYEMVRPSLDAIPDLPLPEGLVVRTLPADDLVARRTVWDAATEAFADERDELEPTEEDWQNSLADPHEDPTLWIVAYDGEEVAGAVLGKIDPDENAYHGRDRGYIDAVFTRRPWRRRGLARTLLARGLLLLRDRGMSSAYLGVDGLNPNQAMDLYTGLGFEVASTSYDWTKPLDGGAMEA